jgi:hypothetical protein
MYESNQAMVGQATEANMIEARQSSVTERLETERKMLSTRLERVENMLELLRAAPETTAVLDALAKLGHRIY